MEGLSHNKPNNKKILSKAYSTANIYSNNNSSLNHFPNINSFLSNVTKSLDSVILKPIKKILIISNGIAAVKSIISLKKFSLEIFNNENYFDIILLTTQSDLHNNQKAITLCSTFYLLSSKWDGPTNLNYNNINLILQVANTLQVDAIYPAWGSSSENPELPLRLENINYEKNFHLSYLDLLKTTNPSSNTKNIKFIGPTFNSMVLLGDKITANIIAQSLNIPTLPWSGSNLRIHHINNSDDDITYEDIINNISTLYPQATISANNLENIVKSNNIDYPLIIKVGGNSSGGGKGIRKVHTHNELFSAYREVLSEIYGIITIPTDNSTEIPSDNKSSTQSSVNSNDNISTTLFLMKLAPSYCRHLEIQILADLYGEVISVFSRDCSLQRRHQKIIEEGPIYIDDDNDESNIISKEIIEEMEKSAIKLVKIAKYSCAATVEFLYDPKLRKYYFLELNPRLQVEHTVTELISNINLVSSQLQICMGVPLDRIPDIRKVYNFPKFLYNENKLNLSLYKKMPPLYHVIACRIVAENVNSDFAPTVGSVYEINLSGYNNDIWGYFSFDSNSGGRLSQYADSQFGHIFAMGINREVARKNMISALKNLKIRGDIQTNLELLKCILEADDFKLNNTSITWLEDFVAKNKSNKSDLKSSSTLNDHLVVVLAAFFLANDKKNSTVQEYLNLLDRGAIPCNSFLAKSLDFEIALIYNNCKYLFKVNSNGPNIYSLEINNQFIGSAVVNSMQAGGVIISFDCHNYVIYSQTVVNSLQLIINGSVYSFPLEIFDPTELRTPMSGKITRFLVSDGEKIEKNGIYAEIEVMKMHINLRSSEAGTIHLIRTPGSVVDAGELIAKLTLDTDLRNSQHLSSFSEKFEENYQTNPIVLDTKNVNALAEHAIEKLTYVLDGYLPPRTNDVDSYIEQLMQCLTNPLLCYDAINEILGSLEGKIKISLQEEFRKILDHYYKNCFMPRFDWEPYVSFPVHSFTSAISKYLDACESSEERKYTKSLLSVMTNSLHKFRNGNSSYTFDTFNNFLTKFCEIELLFSSLPSSSLTSQNALKLPENVIANSRRKYRNDLEHVLLIARSNYNIELRCTLIDKLLTIILDKLHPLHRDFIPVLSIIVSLSGKDYSQLVIKSRQLLMKLQVPSFKDRIITVKSLLETAIHSSQRQSIFDPLITQSQPLLDVLSHIISGNNLLLDQAAIEVYIRRLYRVSQIINLKINSESDGIFARWEYISHSNGMGTTRKISNCIPVPSSSVIDGFSEITMSPILSENQLTKANEIVVVGILGFFPSGLSTIISRFRDVITSIKPHSASNNSPRNVVHIGFKIIDNINEDQISIDLYHLIKSHSSLLNENFVRRVTVFVTHGEEAPMFFTFRPQFQWQEHLVIRHIEAGSTAFLNLFQLSNYRIKLIKTPNRLVHIFASLPKPELLSNLPKHIQRFCLRQRYILRMIVPNCENPQRDSPSLENHPETQLIFIEALNALDFAIQHDYCRNNALFFNFISETTLSLHYIIGLVQLLVKRYADKLRRLHVSLIECLFKMNINGSTLFFTIMCSNRAGFDLIMDVYQHTHSDRDQATSIYQYLGQTLGDYLELNEKPINTPYPVFLPFQDKREYAERADTTWCYDFLIIFERLLRTLWNHYILHDTCEIPSLNTIFLEDFVETHFPKNDTEYKDHLKKIPSTLLKYKELVLNKSNQIEECERPIGQNTVGMVAWRITLYPPQHPQGREIILIVNDITIAAGSFATQEDMLFDQASKLSRSLGIPRIYIAANSGARIGLADEILAKFKVEWRNINGNMMIDYFYLEPFDYNDLKKSVLATKVQLETGAERYKITDIIGAKHGLGVENLQGSAMIAGETSRAYRDVATLSYVSGRSVGIGAYLVRLSNRVIQKTSIMSPIILTGFQALNNMLGKELYTSNIQLGGIDIMYTTGVTQYIVNDDFEGIYALLRWLSYIPPYRYANTISFIDHFHFNSTDDINRDCTYYAMIDNKDDPRKLITGFTDSSNVWHSGLFDKDSWMELMSGWAQSVIVGRARLGDVPIGVIAVETRSTEFIIPADPASSDSRELIVQHPGKVWFPDSAYKTAQTIADIKTEDLPLIILANWRGFSGGTRDMYQQILKYGSYIVDGLVSTSRPIFIYLPPYAELRGGAWVVLDPSINDEYMEMYADKQSCGGVLEPEGTVGVKLREDKEILDTMHRLDEKLIELDSKLRSLSQKSSSLTNNIIPPQPQPSLNAFISLENFNPLSEPVDVTQQKHPHFPTPLLPEFGDSYRSSPRFIEDIYSSEVQELKEKIKQREKELLPLYHQVAVVFAGLHDTPQRMLSKGVINKVIEYKSARKFFGWRLRRRLLEFSLKDKVKTHLSSYFPFLKQYLDILSSKIVLKSFFDFLKASKNHNFTSNELEQLQSNDEKFVDFVSHNTALINSFISSFDLASFCQKANIPLNKFLNDQLFIGLKQLIPLLSKEQRKELMKSCNNKK